MAKIVAEQCIRPEAGEERANPLFAGNLNFVDDCQKVLDIGCGIGSVVAKLGERGYGVTLNSLEIVRAQDYHGAELAKRISVGDMHDLPFEDASFDGAIMWDSLEHALAPIVALWEAHRVLVSRGKLLVYIPPQLWIEHPGQAKWMFDLCGFEVEHLEDRVDEAALYRLRKKT